jgi:acetyl-CoA acyltransferase
MNAWILSYARTPIGRYGGALAAVRPDDLAARAIGGALARAPGVPLDAIEEVVLGCANQAGEDNRNVARMATLLAGLPHTVPGVTVNRLCGSGLDALGYAARLVADGSCGLVIAGGVESMSRAPLVIPKPESAYSRRAEMFDTTIGWRFINPRLQLRYGVDSMPETAENVAALRSIARADQDAFALASQRRAASETARALHAQEIVAVEVAESKGKTRAVEHDEQPRPDTTLEALAKLPTPFRAGGTVTAGNASGVNDGAAALLVGNDAWVGRLGLKPLARVVAIATAGVEPRYMGLGPVPATQKLLARERLRIDQIDLIELNEAFAAQALAVTRELGIADGAEHVNPNGGAIALGHPLGMSGARLAGTAALELARRGGRRALVTMCIGVGQGIAALLEAP